MKEEYMDLLLVLGSYLDQDEQFIQQKINSSM